jgi:hypothetical protein
MLSLLKPASSVTSTDKTKGQYTVEQTTNEMALVLENQMARDAHLSAKG